MQINQELTANQEVWKKELQREKVEKNVAVARKEQELEELRGQVRDLMLHFESSRAIENSGNDVRALCMCVCVYMRGEWFGVSGLWLFLAAAGEVCWCVWSFIS